MRRRKPHPRMAIFGVEVRVDMANNSAEFGTLGQVEIVSKLGERMLIAVVQWFQT
jgi:hypothetical protein